MYIATFKANMVWMDQFYCLMSITNHTTSAPAKHIRSTFSHTTKEFLMHILDGKKIK